MFSYTELFAVLYRVN